MPTFNGYLFKAVERDEPFPNKYINVESWESTPNQREEIKAYREENSRDLHRITATGKKSAFKVDIRDGLHLADIDKIRKWLYNNESDHDERKIKLIFWDDDKLEYHEATDFYTPNPKFKIKKITDNDIIYAGRTLEFIEY